MNNLDFVQKVKNGEIDIVEHTHKVVEEAKKIDDEFNYFNALSGELAIKCAENVRKDPSGNLAGIAVSVKDCICVKGIESRAGSRILDGYRPVFDATVVERAKKAGAIIIGKTSQDEFGFGTFCVNVGLGFRKPLNPIDKLRSCGGSSGGSGGITKKAGFPHISIGESTGGSIAAPASFCGVFGLTPTYGLVSRYGLIDYASSLDKIGAMGKTPSDCAMMLNAISGQDGKDSTSLNSGPVDYSGCLNKSVRGMRIGVISETFSDGIDSDVKDAVNEGISRLGGEGAITGKVSMPLVSKYGVQAYYLIAVSEASTNLAKLCGMRYGRHEKLEGNFNEYFTKVRSMHFGAEAKRRIILGTFTRMAGYRDEYYIKALKIRTKIIEEYKKAFKRFDLLVSPTMPIIAPKFSEIEKLTPIQNYLMDIMTVGPNLAGMPHLNVPVGFARKMPVGMLFIGNHLEEGKLLQAGSFF